ncbi:thioredoxin domain-containing protein [Candidatus Rariloculus sp.]|uniref:thioredoxin domain-containing protein n=1 Tax=Candidatus Rariloculus sp. TaxID=3101265 RepID=UPI003D1451F8
MNRLSEETSPYLVQHADNPVHWQPWDPVALELARRTDRPILLSIGYSACHWCHVMAHESFEDPDTAAIMNRLYVNVKVDREERPDIDRIYQTAQQMFSGRAGGWPLTMFLTPDEHLPIFAGTYFPKAANYGMPAFRDVLVRVESHFRANRDDVRGAGRQIANALDNMTAVDTSGPPAQFTRRPVDAARNQLGETFDNEYGGFGGAPKFPHTTNLDLLLELWSESRARGGVDDGARRMCMESLERMALGGLYDHLGGGFFRYSVDQRWAIPHFEKMLYDNAALLATYADAYAATGEALHARIAGETADWIMRDMQGEQGEYFSTLDADSEGEEGKFYVWTPAELDALLAPDEAAVAKRTYGLDGPANFEGRAWHLQVAAGNGEFAAPADPDDSDADLARRAREKLLIARNARVWPGRDEKAIVAWNGLAIAAMAKASRQLDSPELAASAARAVDFIRDRLWIDGRLKSVYKDGRARFAAYLDDHVFLAAGLLELLQCRWRTADLEFARELLEVVLAHFSDPRGGFFFTADDHEQLIHRPKPLADEALPSGNAVAALALIHVGHLLGEHRYLDAAERTLRASLPVLERYPHAHATMLRGIRRQLGPPELLVVRAEPGELEAWRSAVKAFRPDRLCFFIPADASGLPGLLCERRPGAQPLAYLCRGTECLAPIGDLEALRNALSG